MAARLGNALYWLGCIMAVGWVAVSHAAEKADDDTFILGCIWTGDSKGTVCWGFPTRASCEREGRAAVASGELSKFECISTAELAALLEAIGHIFGADQPTAAGPGGSDQPTFSKQMPVRTAASASEPRPTPQGLPSAPDMRLPGSRIWPPVGGRPAPAPVGAWQVQTVPPQAAGINPGFMGSPQGWAGFERNARPSTNIEDYRRTRGKPFIAQ
jgi:hypothetical protein